MNIQEYQELRKQTGYREQLSYIVGSETSLRGFLNYEDANLEVKLHLTKVILGRHFKSNGEISLQEDVQWFINCFRNEYKADLIKPWLTSAVRESMAMIVSDDTFGKVIIGTTFMFGVVEFYAKYRLGWKPEQYDHFDEVYHKNYREMSLSAAISRLKKTKCALAIDLNELDSNSISLLKESGIEEKRYTKSRIADRLRIARNSMIHGETHYFYSTGSYLAMLYILFHFHGIADGFKYEGI